MARVPKENIEDKPHQLDIFRLPMLSDSTICTEMYTSGAKMTITIVIKVRQQMAVLG